MNTTASIFCAFLALTMPLGVASSAHAKIEEAYEEGSLVIKEREASSESSSDLRIGEKVVFEIPVHQLKDFGGYNAIAAGATMTNTLDREVRATYTISFYDDQNKMIGCFHGGLNLDPLSNRRLSSAIIYTTPENVARVTRYRLRTLVLEE